MSSYWQIHDKLAWRFIRPSSTLRPGVVKCSDPEKADCWWESVNGPLVVKIKIEEEAISSMSRSTRIVAIVANGEHARMSHHRLIRLTPQFKAGRGNPHCTNILQHSEHLSRQTL
jgi:hypothetical protein